MIIGVYNDQDHYFIVELKPDITHLPPITPTNMREEEDLQKKIQQERIEKTKKKIEELQTKQKEKQESEEKLKQEQQEQQQNDITQWSYSFPTSGELQLLDTPAGYSLQTSVASAYYCHNRKRYRRLHSRVVAEMPKYPNIKKDTCLEWKEATWIQAFSNHYRCKVEVKSSVVVGQPTTIVFLPRKPKPPTTGQEPQEQLQGTTKPPRKASRCSNCHNEGHNKTK